MINDDDTPLTAHPVTRHLLCPSTSLGPELEITPCGYTLIVHSSDFSVTSTVGLDTCLINEEGDDDICYIVYVPVLTELLLWVPTTVLQVL